jgi:hypothetical protein
MNARKSEQRPGPTAATAQSKSVGGTTKVDPSLLDVAGLALELLGLADHVQGLLPLQRIRADRRHKRIESTLDQFREALNDARASLRIVRSALSHPETTAAHQDDFAVVMPSEEFTVYSRGLDQLAVSLRKMRNAAFDLEMATSGLPQAQEHYHRMSAAGRSILEQVRGVLAGQRDEVLPALDAIENYLVRASQSLEEATRMRDL